MHFVKKKLFYNNLQMFSNEHTDMVLIMKYACSFTCTDVWWAPEVWDHWEKKV